MPRGNGMGPNGMGPMTGRGRGNCALPVGRGQGLRGRGCGMGHGRGRGYYNYTDNAAIPQGKSSDQELALLKEERNAIELRIKELEK